MPEITGPQLSHNFVISDTGELSTFENKYQLVREMRKHPTVKMARWLSIAPALASAWSVEVQDESLDDDAVRELLNTQIFPHKQKLIERAFLGMIDFGWAPFEVVWDGFDIARFKSLLHDITCILADTTTGEFRGFRQTRKEGDTIDVMDTDCLLMNQYVEGDNHYGSSDSDAAEIAWTQWKNIDETASAYNRKSGGAHWWIRFPVGQSVVDNDGTKKDNSQIAIEMLNKLESNSSIATPTSVERYLNTLDASNPGSTDDAAWKVELIESSGSTSAALDVSYKYADSLIARSYLQPERSILEGKHGTKAESEAQGSIALTMTEHRHLGVLERLNAGPVDSLISYYFGPQFKGKVKVIPEPLDPDKKQFLQEVLKLVIGSPEGMVTAAGDIDVNGLMEATGIPQLNEDEEV